MTTNAAVGPVIDVLRAALAPVAGKITVAFLYGPLARGNAKPNSDIDMFIVATALKPVDILPHFVRAENVINRRINVSIYEAPEVIDKLESGNAFHVAIMKQPKLMLIGAERDLPTKSR